MYKVIDYVGRLYGVNQKYVNRKYALRPEYRNQHKVLADMAWKMFKAQRLKILTGEVSVVMEISTSKDIDAIVKGTLDSLQTAGVYENDSQIVSLIVGKTKIGSKKPERLSVWVC